MRLLDRLYAAGAALAATFLVLIAALTLAQVVGRMIGVLVPDAGDLAGYAMAAATFLALAHTFRSGGHIRVNLLLGRLSPGSRRLAELWCLGVSRFSAHALPPSRRSSSWTPTSSGTSRRA